MQRQEGAREVSQYASPFMWMLAVVVGVGGIIALADWLDRR